MLQNIQNQQNQFLANRAMPSAVLPTDLHLSETQVRELRDRWNESAKGLHQGGTPILTHGLRVMPWAAPALAKDMQIAELKRMSDEHIAQLFRIPLPLLGLGGAPFSSTQSLLQFWLASGLGFALANIEQAFDKLFELAGEPDEFCEFDSAALLDPHFNAAESSLARLATSRRTGARPSTMG